MKVDKLKDMFRGWVVGNFDPSLWKTDDVEVAVKNYKKGDYEPRHYHKIATEITVICKGRVLMNNELYEEGDIITIEPNEQTDFRALNDVITTVIKLPCTKGDKYLVE
jgi:quercetin dioxygenase-like cupin family protein